LELSRYLLLQMVGNGGVYFGIPHWEKLKGDKVI